MEEKNCCLHIIPRDKFTNNLISFILVNFPEINNRFIVIDEGNEEFSITENNYVKMLSSMSDSGVRDRIENAGVIVLHSFSIKFSLKYLKAKRNLGKTCWIIWGSDLYDYRNRFGSIKGYVKVLLRKFFYNQLGYVGYFAKDDYYNLKKWYSFKGKAIEVLYPSTADYSYLASIENTKKDEVTRILVGNNPTETNYHIDILKGLLPYANEDIELYTVLSYGDNLEYQKEVISYGERNFGSKFKAIRKMMGPEEYARFLSGIDVFVMYTDRQQGLGTIDIAVYLGVKLLLRKDAPLYNHYVINQGYKFGTFDADNKMDFENFCLYKQEDEDYNKARIAENLNGSRLVTIWTKAFKELGL